MNRLAALLAVTAALAFAGATAAVAQTLPLGETTSSTSATPLTLDDILEQAAEAEAAAEPSEEEAETRGLPGAPIPYNNLMTADDLDMRIRGASAAAQTLQGPLDGRWSLATQDGAALYSLLFVDSGRGGIEGAWRDVTRGEGLSATGVIDNLSRNGGMLNASFYPSTGQQTVSLNLSQLADGSWSGSLDQGGERRTVRLLRDEPFLSVAPMFGAAGVVSPYRTASTSPARAAPVRKAVVSKKKGGKAKASARKKGSASKASAKKGSSKKAPARKKRA